MLMEMQWRIQGCVAHLLRLPVCCNQHCSGQWDSCAAPCRHSLADLRVFFTVLP